MDITFEPLNESHFPLMLEWLESPHVKKWWDRDIIYTLDLVKEKYSDYVNGYKKVNGVKKPIRAYIICANHQPIGYIQIYNAYDFSRSKNLTTLPESLGTFDVFIGDEKYLGKNIGSQAITKFLNLYAGDYSYIFADPDLENSAAIKAYEKAGFRVIRSFSKERVMWMLKSRNATIDADGYHTVLNQLAMREPIFHHPDKFGKTRQDILDMTCDEFWEVGASGNVYTREYGIDVLLERYNDPHYQDIWETKDFELIQIAPDNYLMTYVLIQGERITRRSTIWRNCNGKWKILYHQGTVVQEGKR